MARATSSSFGSDHLGVYASIGAIENEDDGEDTEDIAVVIEEISIVNALPNPIGEDAGNETITISNNSGEVVDISGWMLRDLANNIYIFPPQTQLLEGENELVLIINTMPLNNSGDSILLLDSSGNIIGEEFVYEGRDVEVGLPVR